MPVLSERREELTQSPIRSLVPFARDATRRGIAVLHLNIGQPDIPTPPQALQAIRDFDQKIIKYGPSEGIFELRSDLANYYRRFGLDLDPRYVSVTTGASEAILFALTACLNPGDEVIIPEPFYANYLGFCQMANIDIVPVMSTLDMEFALPEIEDFERNLTPKTRAIFLCNPGNPTGQQYLKEELVTLMQFVKANDLYLIVDEVYKEFCYDHPFTSVLSFTDMDDHVIVIDSISKTFSSCGARIGFIVSRNEPFLQTVLKYAQLRLCPPGLGQVIARACYQSIDIYLPEVIEEYKSRRELVYQRLQGIEGIKCYRPMAAFYNMVSLPVEDSTQFCTWLLKKFSHKGHTLMLAPADGFYFNHDLGRSQVRIAFVLNEERLELAMDCLQLGLEVYKQLSHSKLAQLG